MNITNKQKSLFKKNSKLLLKKIPSLAVYTEAGLPQNVDIYTENDEIDILINGSRFYGTDAREYAHQQIETYLVNPSLFEASPPPVEEDRTPTHGVLNQKLQDALYKRGIVASPDRLRIDSATTLVFGIGLGFHLYPIVAHTRCRDLVITEVEPIFLVLSMYFIDWSKIFKTLKDRVAIILSQDPDGAFSYIRSHVHPRNPGVLQTIFHFCHYKSNYMDSVYKRFQEKSYLFFDGLGFYDDERVMTRNTVLNMFMDTWRFCGDRRNPVNASAVIVGAGPSLSNDIEWLKKNQGKVIIFSGGSSLQTLLVNGIIPDFHAEIENIPLNYELLKPLFDKYDLSKTILVCSSTMDTKSSRLFDRKIWFIREGVMASQLLAPDLPALSWQNPTVVNTAASACFHLGFRNVILLGADFGTTNQGVHHAPGSAYDTHEDLKKVDFKFPEQVPGNFGGKVYTNLHMKNGMGTLGNLLTEFRGVKAFNGSNGALLNKVTPMKTNRYSIIEIGTSKNLLVDAIYAASKEISWGEIFGKEMMDKIEEDFIDYIKMLRKSFSTASRKSPDFIVYLTELYKTLAAVPLPYSNFNSAISGSVTTQTIIMMYWWRRIPDELISEFERVCRRHWQVFLRVIEKDFVQLLKQVRQELPLVRPELFDDKGILIEAAEQSGSNAER